MKALIGKLLKTVLGFFLPPRESAVTVEKLSSSTIMQGHVLEREPEFGRVCVHDAQAGEAILNYKDKEIRSLLWEFKFYRNRKALSILADTFHEYVIDSLGDELLPDENTEVLLVPIPSSAKRMRSRGYDPLRALVKKVVEIDESGIFENGSGLLIKKRETKRQTEIKNRDERLQNVIDAFGVTKPEKVKGRRVFIIDDITTTGATLREAERALLEAGAQKIQGIALAH